MSASLASKATLAILAVAAPMLAAAQQDHIGIDISELARSFAERSAVAKEDAGVFALVSFSMPEESLERLARDCAAAGVPMVLRGLVDGSARRTLEKVRQADPDAGASWQVDPRPFKSLGINSAPVFAVFAGDEKRYVKGDVSLGYALRLLAEGGDAASKKAASALGRLEGDDG